MALRSSAAILTRIREVLESGAGTLRTIAADTYDPGAHTGRSDGAQATDALVKARVEVRVSDSGPNANRPPRLGSFTMDDIEVEVRVVRSVTAVTALSATARTALFAAADSDGSAIAQALTMPGNLTATEAGAATGIVSGMLQHAGSAVGELELSEGQAGRLVTLHTFTGIVKTATPVTPRNLTAPTISGTAAPDATLSVTSNGVWVDGGASLTFTYRWLLDGSPVSGETSSTYVVPTAVALGPGDHSVVLEVTASNGTASAVEFSNEIGPIAGT